MAALVACLSAGALFGGGAVADADVPSVTKGDVYHCAFVNLPLVFSVPLTRDPWTHGYVGSFTVSGRATCVFTDADGHASPTKFDAQIGSSGEVFSLDQCTADQYIQFTGDGTASATTISGGPEGTITGTERGLYYIGISGTAGVIDAGVGLREPDGDAIQPQHLAGSVLAEPAVDMPGVCGSPLPTTGAFLLTGSFTLHT